MVNEMQRVVKGTYENGVFRPDESVDLEDGARVVMSISSEGSEKKGDFSKMRSSAGGWRDTVDCEKLIEEIYADRLKSSRSEPLPELR